MCSDRFSKVICDFGHFLWVFPKVFSLKHLWDSGNCTLWLFPLHCVFFFPLNSKRVKISGVVTEDSLTGDRNITHMTAMEDTVGSKQTVPEHTDPHSTAQGICFLALGLLVKLSLLPTLSVILLSKKSRHHSTSMAATALCSHSVWLNVSGYKSYGFVPTSVLCEVYLTKKQNNKVHCLIACLLLN